MDKSMATITVKELLQELELYDGDSEVIFCGLDFYRLKLRGEKLVQVEFNQTATHDADGNLVFIKPSESEVEVIQRAMDDASPF